VQIHPTAIVHPKAQLGADVAIGPYSVIGEHVRIGRGSQLMAHVNIDGWTDIGERCQIYPFASIGSAPQHLQYKGEPTRVVIGNDNILREYVTVNRGILRSATMPSSVDCQESINTSGSARRS
jgi:UDP-N-acetylglucosamine acyltransferase